MPTEASNKRLLVVTSLGMALCWPLFRRTYPGLLLAGAPHQELGYLSFLAVQFLMIAVVWGVAVQARSRALPWFAALGALGFLASSLAFNADAFGSFAPAATMVGVGGLAVGTPLLALLWLNVLVELDRRTAYRALALSFVLSFIASLATLLPGPLLTITLLTLPLASVALWLVARSWLGGLGGAPLSAMEAAPADSDPNGSLSQQFIGVIILFVLVGAALRGFSSPTGVAFSPVSDADGILFRNALSIFLAAVFAVITYLLQRTEQDLVLSLLFACLLFLVGLLTMSMPWGEGASLGLSFVNAARNCMEYLLFMAVLTALRAGRCAGSSKGALVRFFLGRFLVPVCAGQLISYVAVPLLLGFAGAGSADDARFFAFISALVIAFGMLAFASYVMLGHMRGWHIEAESAGADVGDEVNAASAHELDVSEGQRRDAEANRREERLAHLGATAGLTDREIDVVSLLSQGYSYKKIAEQLYISMSTVQSHTRNIYRKCGVNSKQELIDLVNGEPLSDGRP